VRDDASLDVSQIGGAFGHQAAHRGEHGDELLDRRMHRREQVLAAAQVCADRRPQPLVASQPCAGGQDFRRGVGRLVRSTRETLGDRLRRLVVGPERGILVERRAVERGDRLGRHLASDHQSGGVADPGNNRCAVEDGGRRLVAHG
jgi:hypothetical protein